VAEVAHLLVGVVGLAGATARGLLVLLVYTGDPLDAVCRVRETSSAEAEGGIRCYLVAPVGLTSWCVHWWLSCGCVDASLEVW